MITKFKLFEKNIDIFVEIGKREKYVDYSYIENYIENGDLTVQDIITDNSILQSLLLNYFDDKYIFKVIDKMIKEGVDFNHINWKNKTAIYMTIEKKRFNVFNYLINKNLDLDLNIQERNNNETIVMKMVSHQDKYYNYLTKLFDKYDNIDLDLQDLLGETALIIACAQLNRDYYDFKVIELLIKNGADWFVKRNNGKTFEDYIAPIYYKNLKDKYKKEYEESVVKQDLDKFNI